MKKVKNERVLTINVTNFNEFDIVRLVRIKDIDAKNVTSTTPRPGKYDDVGALKFIICTLVVYSVFGVFCTLVNRVKGKGKKYRHQDEETGKYIKCERSLKHEGHKNHLLREMRKYEESIRMYEEKMQLLQLQRDFEEEQRLALEREKELTNPKPHKKERKRRRSLGFLPRRTPPAPSQNIPNRKLSLMDNTLGKMGFSFLFMNSKENLKESSAVTLDTVQEQDQENDTEGCIGSRHLRNLSSDARIIEPKKTTYSGIAKSAAHADVLCDTGEHSKHSVKVDIEHCDESASRPARRNRDLNEINGNCMSMVDIEIDKDNSDTSIYQFIDDEPVNPNYLSVNDTLMSSSL